MCKFWKQMLIAILGGLFLAGPSSAQQVGGELSKRIRAQVQPSYPALAHRMGISGVVKIQVTVSASGKITSTKLLGGHPLLAGASEDAIRRWKFEPASDETTGIVEFKFQGADQ
jgi:TonB family protein